LESHGQPLKQKDCFPAILSDGRDAFPDLLAACWFHEPTVPVSSRLGGLEERRELPSEIF